MFSGFVVDQKFCEVEENEEEAAEKGRETRHDGY